MNRGTRQFSNANTTFVLARLAATLALGTIRAPVANAQPEAPHCIGGTDLNELYGISDQIVAPFCPVANAGQRWIATSRWLVEREFEEILVGVVTDRVTGTVLFGSSCDPVDRNPVGEQLFAMRPDGSGLRQLTATRGMTTDPDGTVHAENPGPFAYASEPAF